MIELFKNIHHWLFLEQNKNAFYKTYEYDFDVNNFLFHLIVLWFIFKFSSYNIIYKLTA